MDLKDFLSETSCSKENFERESYNVKKIYRGDIAPGGGGGGGGGVLDPGSLWPTLAFGCCGGSLLNNFGKNVFGRKGLMLSECCPFGLELLGVVE